MHDNSLGKRRQYNFLWTWYGHYGFIHTHTTSYWKNMTVKHGLYKKNPCLFVVSHSFLESCFSYVLVMIIFFYCLVLEIKNQVQIDKIFFKWVNKWVAMGNRYWKISVLSLLEENTSCFCVPPMWLILKWHTLNYIIFFKARCLMGDINTYHLFP